jgi:hypothetical protein
MERRDGEAATRQPRIESIDPERQALAEPARSGRFDRPHLRPENGKAIAS